MTLSYRVIAQAIPEAKGFVDKKLIFQSVSFFSESIQPKGLFVPLFEEQSGKLSTAITNGAIGAIWEKGKEIPSYTPNHFPIFYTNDLKKGFMQMINIYEEQLKNQQNTKTKFIFSKETSLNSAKETYDIAVIKEFLLQDHFFGKEEE
jgi:UDP-N-acetylmuramyl pentapeptide synthase